MEEAPDSLWPGTGHCAVKTPAEYEAAIKNAILYVFDSTAVDDAPMDVDQESVEHADKEANEVQMQSNHDSESDEGDNPTAELQLQYSDDEEMSVNGDQDGQPGVSEVSTVLPRREGIRWPNTRSCVCGRLDAAATGVTACLKCAAYEAHNKAAAETYRTTLSSYTKTVSELMCGVKTIIERYPELRADSSDERVHYIVQAALGRNGLVQEMVRLSAAGRIPRAKPDDVTQTTDAYVHEALDARYTDRDALRMILGRYADLYVRYIQVWRDMCARVAGELTVLEFIDLTADRPGVSEDEAPWSEALAYIARTEAKLRGLGPADVRDECLCRLSALKRTLSYCNAQKTGFGNDDRAIEIDEVRDILDAQSKRWCWDAHMTELYMDVRGDLTILATLVGMGRLAVTTLVHEREVLVSRLRRLTKDLGSAELALREAKSQTGRSSRVFSDP